MSMQPAVKCFLVLSLLSSVILGCTPQQTSPKKPIPIQPMIQNNQIILNTPSTTTSQTWEFTPPADYVVWVNTVADKQRLKDYEKFLQDNRVTTAVPIYQLLKSARSWEKCGRTPYALPSPELWSNALPTLKIIQYLVNTQVLTDFEVTSVYRDYSLNLCAGGAAGSKHVYNSAIDFRLGPEYGATMHDQLSIEDSKRKLCAFWQQHGATLNMGLGVYSTGQIHIDTQGFRTWGPDLTRNTSICNN